MFTLFSLLCHEDLVNNSEGDIWCLRDLRLNNTMSTHVVCRLDVVFVKVT